MYLCFVRVGGGRPFVSTSTSLLVTRSIVRPLSLSPSRPRVGPCQLADRNPLLDHLSISC